MRIPGRLFVHSVDIEPTNPMGGGRSYLPRRPNVAAQVTGTTQLVVDQRPDSDSIGQQITANQMVIVQPEEWVSPGARVTVWKGTPREAELIAASVDYYEHPLAPSSCVLWLV